MMKSGYECRVMGIPKTIDNDLFGTDHCPGFASAAKSVSYTHLDVYKRQLSYEQTLDWLVDTLRRYQSEGCGWLLALDKPTGVPAACLLYTSRCV